MSKKLMIGYQLYSAREAAQEDLAGVLAQLSEMGYQGVEFAGFYDKPAKEIRQLLKLHHLKAASSHVPLQTIREDMQGVIDYHKAIHCKTLVIPYLEEESRPGKPGFSSVLQTIYEFGRLCKKNGMVLLYHNHDFEFVEVSGQAGLDFLFDAIPARLLQTEIDTCWVKYAGADPAAYVRKYAGRCPVVHFKDFEGTKGDKPPYALIGLPESAPGEEIPFRFKPLGHGCQEVASLWLAARESHAKWVIVEQDESTERLPLEDAKLSMDTLKQLK